MTFLHLSLLAGVALVALPIVLHLVMRQKPVRMEFPALRFVQKRMDANRRRLQLRHLILLLLRAAAIALLALALARPSLKLGIAGGSQESPVAAALVFDAAPRMEYRHENRTRLDAAREMGQWLVAQLPEGSEMAVLDTRLGSPAAFLPDRGAAKDRIGRLETVANSQSLPWAVEAAQKLLRRSELARKEVYIFTDLSRGGWPEVQANMLQRRLAELRDLGIYVIDVGVPHPIDYGLGEVKLSNEVLSSRGTLRIETDLSCIGAAAPRIVELNMLDDQGKPQKRAEQNCQSTPGELKRLEFRLGGLTPGVHQGSLRIVGQDGLAADDVRYFTVAVRPAWKVLLAAPPPAERRTLFLVEALAPEVFRKRGQAQFDCDVCDLEQLAKQPLDGYAAVCLVDPAPLQPATWKKLADYAAEGHGVGVFLGRKAVPVDSFNEPQAQQLLPGKLLRQAQRPDGDLWLAPQNFQHPILLAFRGREGSIPWDAFPVFRYWELDRLANDASVVMTYNNGRPALIERVVGQGRVVVMTTPVSDRPNEKPWNLLPVGEAWPFMILANQTASYLVGGSQRQWSYLAGQTALLPLDATAGRQSFLLFAPGGETTPYAADLNRQELAITTTDRVGNYRLRSGGTGGVDLGFSVNYAPDQTRLDRLDDRELAALFGPVKYRLARTQKQIDRDVSAGRVGRELYPPLVLIVALVLGLEMFVANRFYRV